MKFKTQAFLIAASLVAGTFSARATLYDITGADGYNGTSFGGGVTTEDNEVEPNALPGQDWDLEAFFLDVDAVNKTVNLGIVAGFDMKSGNASNATGSHEFEMGDIFVQVKGSTFSDAPTTLDATGTTYVIHFDYSRDTTTANNSPDWATGVNGVSYTVYKMNTAASLVGTQGETGGLSAINPSKKWYANPTLGGLSVIVPTAFAANYADNTTVPATLPSYAGTTHDVLSSIDMSWLLTQGFVAGDNVQLYTTMQCGNDVLRSGTQISTFSVPVPDGGTTLLMLGGGLVGLGLIRRRLA